MILLKCLVFNLTCEVERLLNLFDLSHVSIWYNSHKKRMERGCKTSDWVNQMSAIFKWTNQITASSDRSLNTEI